MPGTEEAFNDRRSLHERIAADLRDEIMGGDLSPGASLPSTQRLKERFGASNATVQKAIGLLKDEGLAVGRPGASVAVRPHRQETVRPADFSPPVAADERYRWLSVAESAGKRGSITLLGVEELRPPAEVAEALELGPDGTAVLRRQVLLHDGEPVELAECYYPEQLARGTALMERRRIKGGTPTLLADLGFPPDRTVDRVSARVPTQAQYTALRLPGDLPVLRTFRVVYSGAGGQPRPIEATVMAKAGHLYELQYEF